VKELLSHDVRKVHFKQNGNIITMLYYIYKRLGPEVENEPGIYNFIKISSLASPFSNTSIDFKKDILLFKKSIFNEILEVKLCFITLRLRLCHFLSVNNSYKWSSKQS